MKAHLPTLLRRYEATLAAANYVWTLWKDSRSQEHLHAYVTHLRRLTRLKALITAIP